MSRILQGSRWYADAERFGVPFAAPYIYPPFFAVVMKPLSRLPFATAYLVWTAGTVLAVVWAVLLSLSLAGVRIGVQVGADIGRWGVFVLSASGTTYFLDRSAA